MPASDPTTRSAARLAVVLESVYNAITGQSTALYRLLPSDAWHQARRGGLDINATEGLETWLDIGQVTFGRPSYQIAIEAQVAMRANPDDDSTSIARIHAAALDLMETLTTWGEPSTGARSVPVSYVFEPLDAEGMWQILRLSFVLNLPRST